MIGEKGRIILGKTLAPKRNFHQFPIRINGKKGPKGKIIATVKVQVNPTLKRRPSGRGWECGWKGWGRVVQELRETSDQRGDSMKILIQWVIKQWSNSMHLTNMNESPTQAVPTATELALMVTSIMASLLLWKTGKFVIWIGSESVVTEVMC